jgi:hypothetical protein
MAASTCAILKKLRSRLTLGLTGARKCLFRGHSAEPEQIGQTIKKSNLSQAESNYLLRDLGA